jgi:capsular polysaccharide transport system permease protein
MALKDLFNIPINLPIFFSKFSILKKFQSNINNFLYKNSIIENPEGLPPQKQRKITKKNQQFFKKIIIFFLSFIYFIFIYKIYRSRYVVSSAFVIKTASANTRPQIRLPLQIGGDDNVSISDARYVKTFLHSPQLFVEIEKNINFTEKYKKRFPDLLSGVYIETPFKRKLEFYRNNVKIRLDESTGELFINTYAFDPKTSYLLNNFLLQKSEQFINDFNINISKKQLIFASEEVKDAYQKFKSVQNKLESFQNKNLLFDGFEELRATNSIINGLESELIRLKIELSTIKRNFVDSEAPEITFLSNQIDEIKNQIMLERELLYSDSGKELNSKAIELRNIESDLQFKKDLYVSALSIQEQTRIDSIKQKRFITTVINPYIPQIQDLNTKHKLFFSTIFVIFIVNFLFNFIFGSIKSDFYK